MEHGQRSGSTVKAVLLSELLLKKGPELVQTDSIPDDAGAYRSSKEVVRRIAATARAEIENLRRRCDAASKALNDAEKALLNQVDKFRDFATHSVNALKVMAPEMEKIEVHFKKLTEEPESETLLKRTQEG